jgi:NodT family efflux transporter outer membrane factor (OMF) lipoprotein
MPHTSRLARFILVAAALALGGCPLPRPPASDDLRALSLEHAVVPPKWTAGEMAQGDVLDGWLATFHDPALEALVAEAMKYNYDLKIAAARVEAAEANARVAGATVYPQLGVRARGGTKLSGDESGLNGVGLFASWELDLWGRVRAQAASGTAAYEATAFDAWYARQSIAALVAKSWFTAKEAAAQVALAEDSVKSAEELSRLANDRLRVGKGDEFDVNQADASILAYRDKVLQGQVALSSALRAIEILVGRYPSAALAASPVLPAPPPPIPVGLPSQLLERRADVRAAERRVAAAFHMTTEARAARLPRIALTASGSTISSDLFFLKSHDNPAWSAGAALTFPLFTGGNLQAQVDVRNADQKAAIADYGRIGSRAFGEVENALASSFNLEERNTVLLRSVAANERALGFSRVRFDVGTGDQRGVQEQLLNLFSARSSLVHVEADRLVQRVNLHLALGGGFEPADAQAQTAAQPQKQ